MAALTPEQRDRFRRHLAVYEAQSESERKATLRSWMVDHHSEPESLSAADIEPRVAIEAVAPTLLERNELLEDVNERRRVLGRRSIL